MLSQNVIDLTAIAAAGGLMIFALMKWCELCVCLALRGELSPNVTNVATTQTNTPGSWSEDEPRVLADRPIGV